MLPHPGATPVVLAEAIQPAQRPTPQAVRTVAGLALIGTVAALTVLVVAILLIRRNRARLQPTAPRHRRTRRHIPDAWRESARRLPDRDTTGHETVDLDPDDLDPDDLDRPTDNDDDENDDDDSPPPRGRPTKDRP